MKQRIVILTAVLAALNFTANAQAAARGTTFGIRAGVNFTNLNGKDPVGNKLENKLNTGFNVGLNAEIPVAPDYFVQPGVLLTTKGAQYSNDSKITFSYIEVPINFLYKPVLADGKLLLGFGPYAAYAVDGKIKPANGQKVDIDFGDGGTFQHFDAGANFLAGYELASKISFQINAQLGLINIARESQMTPNSKATVKNTGFGASLGYRF